MMWCFPVVWSLDRHRNLSVKLTAIRGVNKIRESVEPILRRTPPNRKTTLYRKTPLHCTGRPRGSDCRISWANDKFVMDRNLYWDTSHPAGNLKFGDATLAQWQARGHDRNSLIADPLFVDAARFDFQLRTDSPAFKLGFEPIDTSKIGLYGDPVWVDAPKRIARETYVPMPPPEPQPLAIEDDFDVRIEPGAIGHFEWREYSNGEYRVGPSVWIEGDGRMVSAS